MRLFGGNKPKAAKGGDETYAQDVAMFHELNTRVRAIDAAVKSYDRQITGTTFSCDDLSFSNHSPSEEAGREHCHVLQ
jgi:hypothetical protein